eukprot:6492649-Amphidinium_carterae.1
METSMLDKIFARTVLKNKTTVSDETSFALVVFLLLGCFVGGCLVFGTRRDEAKSMEQDWAKDSELEMLSPLGSPNTLLC